MKINLQSLFTVVCMLTVSVGAMAQNFNIVLFEDFDATTTPVDWTQTTDQTFPAGISSTTPSAGWAFGEGAYTSINWNVPASLDGSPFAISNDDVVDQNRLDDLLMSPVMDLTSYDSAVVLYETFYDSLFQASLGFFLISYDAGANWLSVPITATTFADGWLEEGIMLPNTLVLGADTYILNNQMMIGFVHLDRGAWASGLAIDNVIVAGYNTPCDDVVIIPSCGAPETITLNGLGVLDWEFQTGCGFTTFGQEQLYSFTPSVSGIHTLDVTSATGNSWIDYMWKPASAGCDTIDWNCLGDANAPQSYGMNLTAGVEYLILADNEFIDSETQTFSISCPCTFTSQGFTPESEPCSMDMNGGCNSTPAAYETIACGGSVSGTLWADGGNRDTDWYQLVVTENTNIVVDFAGGMPINAILVDNCTDLNTLDEATIPACGSANLTFAATPGTYILAIVPTAFEAYPCGSGSANQYDLTVTYCENSQPVNPCLTSADTWPDLNTAGGGAPCNDGTGCVITDPDFNTAGIGVYGSETYLLANVQAGYDYIFDMCSGVGVGSWIPEVAIVAPDGTTVDAWNGEAASGSSLTFIDQCSIAWTASQSGTYSIIINQLGTAAGDAPNQVDCETSYAVDNGNPTVTCGINPAPCLPAPSNDECAGATSLQVNENCTPIVGDVNLATESLLACTGFAVADVWFSFVATSSEATIEVAGSLGFDVVFEVFEMSCAGTSVVCEDLTLTGETESTLLTGLTPGMTYYIRVYDYYDVIIPATTTFDICVFSGPITSIDEESRLQTSVYPNPSNGEFTVEIDNVDGRVEFSVFDMASRVVFTEVYNANGSLRTQLVLSDKPGSYILQMITNKTVSTERLIVE